MILIKGLSFNTQTARIDWSAIPRLKTLEGYEEPAADDEYVCTVVDCPGCPPGFGRSELGSTQRAHYLLGQFVQMGAKTPHQLRVDKMMRLIAAIRAGMGLDTDGQAVPRKPRMLNRTGRLLRASLILEEASELIEGLGFIFRETTSQLLDGAAECEPDLKKIADGCFDLSVVNTGTLSAFGLPDERGLEIVDLNNLDKFKPGHTIRGDGKLIKPPDHKPPDLKAWLEWVEGLE